MLRRSISLVVFAACLGQGASALAEIKPEKKIGEAKEDAPAVKENTSKDRIPEMTRRSPWVAVGNVTKVDTAASPPQVDFAVSKYIKGSGPKALKIGMVPDDEGGDDPDAPMFQNGKRYLIFILQLEENKYAFLYQNLSGKFLAVDNKWLDDAEKVVQAANRLDEARDRDAKTKALSSLLTTGIAEVRLMALKELTNNAGQFNIVEVKDEVTRLLDHVEPEVRRFAVRSVARISTQENKSGKVDLKLAERFIKMLDDKDAEVRKVVHQQLQSLSRQRIGFEPAGDAKARKEAVDEWKAWLDKEKHAKEINLEE
ncbi:MAG: hypothetical protein GMKNLPBB_03164 [Myxococcota bacterium]|nr:hypothetical protein [Myxococcota bacterium]